MEIMKEEREPRMCPRPTDRALWTRPGARTLVTMAEGGREGGARETKAGVSVILPRLGSARARSEPEEFSLRDRCVLA